MFALGEAACAQRGSMRAKRRAWGEVQTATKGGALARAGAASGTAARRCSTRAATPVREPLLQYSVIIAGGQEVTPMNCRGGWARWTGQMGTDGGQGAGRQATGTRQPPAGAASLQGGSRPHSVRSVHRERGSSAERRLAGPRPPARCSGAASQPSSGTPAGQAPAGPVSRGAQTRSTLSMHAQTVSRPSAADAQHARTRFSEYKCACLLQVAHYGVGEPPNSIRCRCLLRLLDVHQHLDCRQRHR